MSNKPPKKWKLAFLVWVFIYPVITILPLVLAPLIGRLSNPIKTLTMSAILVPVMVFIYIPFINKRFSTWMQK